MGSLHKILRLANINGNIPSKRAAVTARFAASPTKKTQKNKTLQS